MIGDPLIGPAGDDEGDDVGAVEPSPTDPIPESEAPPDPEPTRVVPVPVAPTESIPPPEVLPDPEPTRVVPAPVLPPGGLALGAPPPAGADPLWAATIARPSPVPPPPPPVAAAGGLGAEFAAAAAVPATGGADLAATAALSAVVLDDLTATTAMPGVARSAGPHDTAVIPTVAAPAPAPGAEHAPGFAKAMRRHRRRWWRRSFKAVLVLVFLAFVYVGVNFALVLRTANIDQARPVDVIVVLGAAQYNGTPSPQLEARLEHTVDLWNEGLAQVVFVTGGKQPADEYTEAESSRDYLVEHGVPADAIQMEDTAHSTWESLSNFADVADAQEWKTVLLVTDPFHSLRSRLIAQELGFTAYTSPTRTSPVQGGEELLKEIKESLGISLGRIIGFERLWKLTG